MLTDIRTLRNPNSEDIPGDDLDFLRWLGGPTWIECPGRDATRSRAVVTLLHGNEPSGVSALRAWLASGQEPATNVVCFIASVQTALTEPTFSHRLLPGQPDANRCFLDPVAGPVGENSQELLTRLRAAAPEALIDLHNNSGDNPAYGVGYGVDAPRLRLTALFADRYMNSNLRLGTLIEATEPWFPSVTIECGKHGQAVADATALAGLERFLQLEDLKLSDGPGASMRVLHHPVRIVVAADATLNFTEGLERGFALCVRRGIDRHNFERLAPGSVIGWTELASLPLKAFGREGVDVAQDLFELSRETIVTRRSLTPVMMTSNPTIAKSDCLFYAMLGLDE